MTSTALAESEVRSWSRALFALKTIMDATTTAAAKPAIKVVLTRRLSNFATMWRVRVSTFIDTPLVLPTCTGPALAGVGYWS
ncbi:MAG: hypothetical protein AAF822_02145 [Pseudomonadota bacterium]